MSAIASSPSGSDAVLTPGPPGGAILSLEVQGMKCAGCVRAVEQRLTQQPGVVQASVNLVTQVATVNYQPDRIDSDRLAQSLTEMGFPSQRRDRPQGTPTALAELSQGRLRQQVQQLITAAFLLVFASLGHLEHLGGWHLPGLSNLGVHWALATLTLLFPARSIAVNGWQSLRHGIPTMNTLVALGAGSAYLASCVALVFPQLGWECFFDEPVMLLGFILLGRTLEERARHRAGASLRHLLSLQPGMASLITDWSDSALTNAPVVEVAADRLRVGERLRVLPGEKFPVDGQVLAGQSTVEEAMLTGESLPVLKQAGQTVVAGSLNLSGVLVIEATKVGAETTLAQIIQLVETAQATKAPIQRLADRVAGFFTYGVMAAAVLTFLFWFCWGSHWWPQVLQHQEPWLMSMTHTPGLDSDAPTSPLLLSLKLAIAVLVIACPCALGLATPTALLVGSGRGAEQGLLIRSGEALEQIDRLDTLIFDKTGTLTTGQPQVVLCEVWPIPSPDLAATIDNPEQKIDLHLLQRAASVEAGTRHPLAQAIRHQAQTHNLPLLAAAAFHTEPGLGVSAQVEGVPTLLGNQAWLAQHGISLEPDLLHRSEALARQGQTVIYLAQNQTLLGLIGVVDPLRSDAPAVITQLQQWGLQVQILSGDRPATTQAIAQQLHLSPDQVLAEVRPGDKATVIRRLQEQGQRVAMVGDGINDAPALAQADVGIALRSGTEVAMETAQIVLMGDRLTQVVDALQLGRATLQTIRQNLFWALAYNTLGIPVAAGILLPSLGFAFSPALAGALMAFSSITVVTNSLRLRPSFQTKRLH